MRGQLHRVDDCGEAVRRGFIAALQRVQEEAEEKAARLRAVEGDKLWRLKAHADFLSEGVNVGSCRHVRTLGPTSSCCCGLMFQVGATVLRALHSAADRTIVSCSPGCLHGVCARSPLAVLVRRKNDGQQVSVGRNKFLLAA